VTRLQQSTNRASTGVVAAKKRPTGLLPVWRGLREQDANRASTGVAGIARTRRQLGFYRYGPKLQGSPAGSFRTPLLNLPAVPSDTNKGRHSKRSVNRASTGVTMILRGFTGPGLTGHRFSTRRHVPNANKGGRPVQDANRASTGVANQRTKVQPTGLLPVWLRSCSRKVRPRRALGPEITVATVPLLVQIEFQ
jgi:hypothetical protein